MKMSAAPRFEVYELTLGFKDAKIFLKSLDVGFAPILIIALVQLIMKVDS
jgi:hypothetical protein